MTSGGVDREEHEAERPGSLPLEQSRSSGLVCVT